MRPKLFLATACLLLATALLSSCSRKGDTIVNTSGSTVNGISVSGVGFVFGTPDVALLTVGVQVQADDVGTARESAAQTAQAVADSIKKNGVADKDIQTTQFNINPQYDFRDGRQVLRGYQVTNIMTVKIRKIDTTSKVIDDATKAGGNNTVVQSLSFTIDDPAELRRKARDLALADAKAKAEQLAATSGVKSGKPISITENANLVPANFVQAPRTGDSGTTVQSGELQVNVVVQVVYSIE
jgi:uncharacterized protein YggE